MGCRGGTDLLFLPLAGKVPALCLPSRPDDTLEVSGAGSPAARVVDCESQPSLDGGLIIRVFILPQRDDH